MQRFIFALSLTALLSACGTYKPKEYGKTCVSSGKKGDPCERIPVNKWLYQKPIRS